MVSSDSTTTFDRLAELPKPKPAAVIDMRDGTSLQSVIEILRTRGFCILRNLFDDVMLDEVTAQANRFLAQSAVAGVPGYWKVDHPKIILNPFVLGGRVLDILLDERVISIIESLMESECILAETILKQDYATTYPYFAIHSDFAEGWSKSDKIEHKLAKEDMRQVIGIGGAFYFHDTEEGSFTFCDGTHTLMSPHGQTLTGYNKEQQRAILARKVACTGHRGDLVLFDDRGFHGPDFPSSADRRIILLDYYRVDTIGRLQVTPMPIWSTDIATLSPTQLRVAGVGAESMLDPLENAQTRFKKNRIYSLLQWGIRHAYIKDHLKNKLKHRLGRL